MVVLWAVSCSKAPTPPKTPPHLDPQTELTYAPVEFDTTSFRVHFYWSGYDDDGEVLQFRYAVDSDTLRPSNEWRTTSAKDTILLFLVDPVKELKLHVFKVAAEDNEHRIDPTPASRAFSAKTLPPTSKIEKGPGRFNDGVGPNFTFQWSGIDPDGGETGGKVPVDSFQYLLLPIGGIADLATPPTHDPLPRYVINAGGIPNYVTIINAAVGDALPAGNAADRTRWDDWKWIGIRGLKNRFRNVTPGEYVFALRAVDIAGATEKNLKFGDNIRHFNVTNRNAGPQLIVCSSILNRCLTPAAGPDDFARKQLQVFEGETVSFSWSANADSYGGEIVGYTYAMDDTSMFQGLDIRQTGATFQPDRLPPGSHFLYVRAVDDGGLITNLVLPLLVVHPKFKEMGYAHQILFVDDSDPSLGNGSKPTDKTETEWWTLNGPGGVPGPLTSIFNLKGIPSEEWDAVFLGQGNTDGRVQPPPNKLAFYTTVIWTVDNQNGASIQTALFKSVAGGDYSELQGYMRAGGTVILTGWNLAQNTSGKENLTYKVGGAAQNGICAAFAPGSTEYQQTIFPRMFMGIDNTYSSIHTAAKRSAGLADFTRAIPTQAGLAFGFDTARVDTGNASIGVQYPSSDPTATTYKWNTQPFGPAPGTPESQLFPGLGVEGWIMAQNFGCQPIQNFAFEDPSASIAQVVYTYHGARLNVIQDGPPSPREGMACGVLVQSHDLATNAGRPYVATAAVGRSAFFSFPLYFMKDADAVNIVTKSFLWVDQSRTLGTLRPTGS